MVEEKTGEIWFGYVGPWFDGGGFSRHEVHMGFVLGDDDNLGGHVWDDAKRYTKFRHSHKEATLADWDRTVQLMKPLQHLEFHPRFYAILLTNEAFGRAFPLMFTHGPIICDESSVGSRRMEKVVSNLEFVIKSFEQENGTTTALAAVVSPSFWANTCTIL